MGISGFILIWILISCAVSPFIGMFLARHVARNSQEADDGRAAIRLARIKAGHRRPAWAFKPCARTSHPANAAALPGPASVRDKGLGLPAA